MAVIALLALALAAAEPVDAGASPPPAPMSITPPVAIEMPPIDYPADAPAVRTTSQVTVLITVGVDGSVTDAEVQQSLNPQADAAVIAGVKRFRFKPATANGEPVPVRLPFTQTFTPPPPPPVPNEPERDAVLEGLLIERGTRAPIANATVVVTDADGRELQTQSDTKGVFQIPVRSGQNLKVQVYEFAHEKFFQREVVAKGQRLQVKYLLTRKSYDPYESTVRSDRDRTEVSRTTLSGRELTRVPGTFGDPFRAVNTLPGVSQVMSLLPLPIVRGSSPGDTGVFLDGVRLPLLFHLFGGPSVVHPELIDHVDFYPGGFPVNYGGYTGGIIDGQTRASKPDEQKVDLDVNLVQAGALVREPIEPLGMTFTAAGRTGYPGLVLSLLTPNLKLAYWDYQVRLDGGSSRNGWTIFSYGAEDVVRVRASENDPLTTVALFTFHRVDLRYRRGDTESNQLFRVVLGYDDSLLATDSDRSVGAGTGGKSWSVNPQARVHQQIAPVLDLNAGADVTISTITTPPDGGAPSTLSTLENPDGTLTTAGVFVEAVLRPTPQLSVIPGVRADLYHETGQAQSVDQSSIDPRLMARYKISDAELGGTTLKGVVGRYHQPPRLFVPVPGLEQSSLDLGLLASTQTSVGAETRLGPSSDLDLNLYYNDNNPVLFDLTVNPTAADVQQPQPAYPPWQLPPPSAGNTQPQAISDLYTKRAGRAYGLELLLRHHDSNGLFGWISYSLSRSERQADDGTWQPSDFDRTHILNFVAGIRLPRNWEFGARVLYQSGTPLTTIFGTNISRSDPEFQLDLRIDKRAVWNTWLLDFYVDILNSTVSEETGGLLGGQGIRFVIPTVGIRAVL